jgi:hypothetical protein
LKREIYAQLTITALGWDALRQGIAKKYFNKLNAAFIL